MRTLTLILAAMAAGIAVYLYVKPNTAADAKGPPKSEAALVEIAIPASLSQSAEIGKTAFEAKCSGCHGVNAVGQDGAGPPLVHKIYEPSHHGDESFQRAVAVGVRGHHWRFGNMEPVDGLTRADVKMIVEYVRELQRANGIH